MKRTLNYALLACAVAIAPVALAEESNCSKVSEAVMKLVAAKPDNVLAIVARQTGANPSCACEVVKAAIVATEAPSKLVGQIVATAIEASPEKMNVITACAIAVAPDALPQIKAVLAKLDPKLLAKTGNDPVNEAGPKGAKDAIVTGINVRNPLDGIYLVPGLPPIHPDLPPIHPPIVPSTCSPDQFPNISIQE
jgi:hypothetical protein